MLPRTIPFLLLAACSSTSWRPDAVVSAGRIDVRLEEPAEVDARQPFEHPAEVAPGALADALGALRFRGDQGVEPVFAGGDTAPLARALATGLERARPEERVRFSLDREERRVPFPRWLTSRGVVFVRPAGTLNVVFESLDRDLDLSEEGDWREPTVWAQGRELVLPEAGEAAALGLAHGGHPAWCTLELGALARVEPEEGPALAPGLSTRERELLARQLYRLRAEGALTDEELARELRALDDGAPPP